MLDQPLSALPWLRLASLNIALGVCLAATVMCLAMLRQPDHRRRWAMLAAMGMLEAGYCAALIPFILAPTPAESLRWIRSTSVFMPFMTWLVVALTVDVAGLQRHWMAKLSRFTLVFSAAFSLLVALDMLTGGRIIFTGVRHDPGTIHLKVVQATPLGKTYLIFVSAAFYTSFFFLLRHWRRHDRALTPALIGGLLYFAAITNDFNLVFGLYDFAFLQHYGFLAMYMGFAAYMARVALRTSRALRRAHEELRLHRETAMHGERLRSMGTLAAFVAHEFGNGLQVVRSGLATLDISENRPSPTSDTDSAVLESLRRASDHMAGVLRGLRAMSRDGRRDPMRPVRLLPLVHDALALVGPRARRAGIRLDLEVEGGFDPRVMARSTEIVQAVVNLVANAIDAVEHTEDPWIEVAIRADGDDLSLTVTDAGAGIPLHLRERILEPFFTTKDSEHGTGLGLPIVARVATLLGGELRLDPAHPHTRFELRLPLAGDTGVALLADSGGGDLNRTGS